MDRKILINVSLPGWVKWRAQDADGMWYGYDYPPAIYEDTMVWDKLDSEEVFLCKGVPTKNWRKTLKRV